MIRWKKLRISLLAATCGGVIFVLGKSILFSAKGVPTFVLPATVPLPAWQPLTSRPLVEQNTGESNFELGKHYRYIQNRVALDIEMRYLVDTNGDLKALIKKYFTSSSSQPSLVIRQNDIGFYGLFSEKERVHLSACINPHGVSTATIQQFWQNQNSYEVLSTRLLPWLLGQENLRIGDRRCLWADLSVPLTGSSPESAYLALENTWVLWYQWWRRHLSG